MPYLWPTDRPDLRMRVVIALIALIAAKAVSVVGPFLFKDAVDNLGNIDVTPVSVTIILVLAYVASRVMTIGFAQIRDYIAAPVGQHAQRVVGRQTFQHLHDLSLRFHLERRTGGLSRVIERGVLGIDFIVRFTLFNIVPTIIELMLVCIILAYVFNGWFPLVTLITIGGYIWFTFSVTEWRTKFRRQMNDRDTEANVKAVDSLLNFETVKYFGNEGHEAARYDKSLAGYEAAAIRTNQSLALLNGGQSAIFNSGLAILLVLSVYGISNGLMTVGEFTMVNLYMMQLYQPLNLLGMVYREVKQSLVDMEKMFDLLKVEPEVSDPPDAAPLSVSGAAIKFEKVSFHYESNRPILKDISFEVPAGKMVAVVGPSGAGKSTLSRILYRFYDISEGQVTIDGQDIGRVTQKSLRGAIGIVPQDTVLFNDTIRYNIRYGMPEANNAAVEDAAKLAQIHDFVRKLPDGYDSMVGERGLKLSGGEKQRVAIARTILKDPPILLLDEATSALDTHTEKEIQSSLRDVSQNRTTLVIAHRLSTVIDADEILVLEAGRITERGRHDDLLRLEGAYSAMWRKQQEAVEAKERLESAFGAEDPLVAIEAK
jgi:ATP-binding cassette subfamily B protein